MLLIFLVFEACLLLGALLRMSAVFGPDLLLDVPWPIDRLADFS
jgi:hypothetical protein